MGPPRGGMGGGRVPKDLGHIKKPLNAFMLFMKEQRPRIMDECTLKESAAINQILGRKVSIGSSTCLLFFVFTLLTFTYFTYCICFFVVTFWSLLYCLC